MVADVLFSHVVAMLEREPAIFLVALFALFVFFEFAYFVYAIAFVQQVMTEISVPALLAGNLVAAVAMGSFRVAVHLDWGQRSHHRGPALAQRQAVSRRQRGTGGPLLQVAPDRGGAGPELQLSGRQGAVVAGEQHTAYARPAMLQWKDPRSKNIIESPFGEMRRRLKGHLPCQRPRRC